MNCEVQGGFSIIRSGSLDLNPTDHVKSDPLWTPKKSLEDLVPAEQSPNRNRNRNKNKNDRSEPLKSFFILI